MSPDRTRARLGQARRKVEGGGGDLSLLFLIELIKERSHEVTNYPELKAARFPSAQEVIIDVLEQLIHEMLMKEEGWTEASSEKLNELIMQLKEAKRARRLAPVRRS